MSDAQINISLGGEKYRATPENTSLYLFAGELAMYNHVYHLKKNEVGEPASGVYIFNFNTGYEALKKCLIENRFPLFVNQRSVQEGDVSAHTQAIDTIKVLIPNTIPESWE